MRMLQAFWRDARGNFAVAFSFLVIPVIMAIGTASDYSRTSLVKSKAQQALDAAALATVRALATNAVQSGDVAAYSRSAFDAAFGSFMGANVASFRANMQSGQDSTLALDATISAPLAFSKLLTHDNWSVPVRSTATLPFQGYYSIILAIDVSSSMTVGGTSADVTGIKAANGGCAFTCHDVNNYKGYGDVRTAIKNKGLKAKIDYAQVAVKNFVDALVPIVNISPSSFKISFITFGSAVTTKLDQSSDTVALTNAANALDVEVLLSNSQREGWTDTTSGLAAVRSKIAAAGDGTTAAAPKTYVILISDGLQDLLDPYGRVLGTGYTTECAAIKAKGATVWSVHSPTPTDADATYPIFNTPTINAMKSCATDTSTYFLASDGPAIVTAVNSIFHTISGSIRLAR